MTDPFSAASTKDNVLANSLTRLPLGGSAEGSPLVVWVPTNKGGILTVTCTSDGSVQILESGKPVGVTAGKQVTYTVPPGAPKPRVIVVTGSSPSVSCKFRQEAYARQGSSEKKDEVLVPYTFWFWPTVRGGTPFPDRAVDVLKRYARAINQGAQEAATGAWEHDEHGQASGAPWAGHCHFAAPASALFELPTDTTIGGEQFSLDEMKFLGTEFFGNFGDFQEVFKLEPPSQNTKFWPTPRLLHHLECFKPGGPYTVEEGARVMMMLDRTLDLSTALTVASSALGQMDPASLALSLTVRFAERAAELLRVLMDELLIAKQPLFGDMRTTDPNSGPGRSGIRSSFITTRTSPRTQTREIRRTSSFRSTSAPTGTTSTVRPIVSPCGPRTCLRRYPRTRCSRRSTPRAPSCTDMSTV